MKPKILISRCLGYEACRYDGTQINSPIVDELKAYVDFVTACPEVEMGLSVPRNSVRIILKDNTKKLVDSMNGTDHTEKMTRYIEAFDWQQDFHGVILKNRSPSCGLSAVKTYPGHGKQMCTSEKSTGFFGQAVLDALPNLPVEDEGRLLNYTIREAFLTGVFRLAAFDPLDMKGLIEYHSNNKYLLMAYNQELQKVLGRLVANHDHAPFDQVKSDYYSVLKQVFNRPVEPGRNENVILHMFGYFSQDLEPGEKDFFFELVKSYKSHQLPFSALMTLMYSWILRFDVDYLIRQTIFEPFPKALLNLRDSGKGRL